VYFFYDPAWRALSPGTFSILVQLEYARARGKPHAYPGYWIAENRSMAYKERFRPFEVLTGRPSDVESPEWSLHRP
jgi:arginine-tRNA-protein transferase